MGTTSRIAILLILCPALLATAPLSAAPDDFKSFDRPTKLLNLETGYCLGPGGSVQIGIGQSGFGLGGSVQLTTDTFLDLLTFVNGQVKVALGGKSRGMPSIAAGFGWYTLVSSELIIDRIIEETFTDARVDVGAGLDMYYGFVTASAEIGRRARAHLGYQHRYLDGDVESRRAFEIGTDVDTMQVGMSIRETATHRCALAGIDVDPLPGLKFLFEAGWDFSCGHARGGAGVRLGLPGNVALQAGVLWPGVSLDDDIDLPVLPTATIHVRF
ncbi:MAG: hypothetical protein JW876_01230 [Candidatus Krumholzibacteriota bacterium]|nr:hypothetical protein [Candidatus Krumholzibacteriota bacterium]